MAETVNQGTKAAENAAQTTPETAETRSFSQAELDAILGERLSREKEKYADYDELKRKAGLYDAAQEAGKTELQKAQETATKYKTQLDALQQEISARNARDKVSAETGVPASLLTGKTEEECKTQADAILSWHGQQPKYPSGETVGGEPSVMTGGTTRDQFAGWASAALKKT